MEDTLEALIHHQWHNGSTHHGTPESCVQLGNSETKVFCYRKTSPGALQCSFCGPHTQFRVHITARSGRCFPGPQLALLPPQPSASTSAKAGMKEAFQRKQTDPVTPDKRLQEVVSWHSSWHAQEPFVYNQALPLPAMWVLLTPASTHC